MNRVRGMYGQRRFPCNWLIFLAALAALTPAIYLLASLVVWLLAPPTPQSLAHLIRTGWKFRSLIIFVFAVNSVLFDETKERLELRNAELQRSVEMSALQLEKQEQDLQRAREMQETFTETIRLIENISTAESRNNRFILRALHVVSTS